MTILRMNSAPKRNFFTFLYIKMCPLKRKNGNQKVTAVSVTLNICMILFPQFLIPLIVLTYEHQLWCCNYTITSHPSSNHIVPHHLHWQKPPRDHVQLYQYILLDYISPHNCFIYTNIHVHITHSDMCHTLHSIYILYGILKHHAQFESRWER